MELALGLNRGAGLGEGELKLISEVFGRGSWIFLDDD